MIKRVVISGANGFIGSHLVNYFVNQNWKVIALVRKLPKKQNSKVNYEIFDLEDPTEISVFDANTIFIHTAFLKDAIKIENQDANFYATQYLIELAKKAGVKQCVFFSTLSVSSEVQSYYAYQKRQLETLFDLEKDLIIRPGLVLGNGGLFYSTFKKLEKFRILPILNGGKQAIYYVAINDIIAIVTDLIKKKQTGIYSLFQVDVLTFKDFYTKLFQYRKKKIIVLNIPFSLLKTVISVTNFLNITAITKDNLTGLKASQTIKPENYYKFNYQDLETISKKINYFFNH